MTVNGEGHITARPNQAKLTLGVVTEHTSAEAAQQENAEISNRVIEALKQIGIDESEIKTTVYSVQPRYDYHDGKSILRGYEVEHHFEVTIKDLSKIGNVYDLAIKNGANRSGGIQFQLTDSALIIKKHYKERSKMPEKKQRSWLNPLGPRYLIFHLKLSNRRINKVSIPYDQLKQPSSKQRKPLPFKQVI